jgi:hypothetical protein
MQLEREAGSGTPGSERGISPALWGRMVGFSGSESGVSGSEVSLGLLGRLLAIQGTGGLPTSVPHRSGAARSHS